MRVKRIMESTVTTAANAEPGRVYRPRARKGWVRRTSYLTVAPSGTARRVAKRLEAKLQRGAITGAELSQLHAVRRALEDGCVLLVLHSRWTEQGSDKLTRHESHSYVAAPPDYELRELKAKPGYS